MDDLSEKLDYYRSEAEKWMDIYRRLLSESENLEKDANTALRKVLEYKELVASIETQLKGATDAPREY